MNNLMICDQEMQLKEYNGQRVVTLKDIDTVHQRSEGTARRNFNTNIDRFIEGEDYYHVCADEFRSHKIGELSPKAHEDITVLTESGYLMLAKSLTDDRAWRVQRALVKSYFRVRATVSPMDTFRLQMGMAKIFAETTGIPLEIATAGALGAIQKQTGIDCDHWRQMLPARISPRAIPDLNATGVGALLGLTAQYANIQLAEAGLQTKVDKHWRLTDAGKEYGEEMPFERNGHHDYRVLWRPDVADAIRTLRETKA